MTLHPSTKPRRRAHRGSTKRWIKRGLLAALVLAMIAAIVYAWRPKPVVADIGTVRRTSLEVEVAEDGQTRVRDRFVVSAPIQGALERIELDPGQDVEAGAVLARIAPLAPALLDERTRREAQARLTGAQAHERTAQTTVARAKVAYEASAREAHRARMLFAGGAIAAVDRDQAEDAVQLAKRDVASAETERARAAAEAAAIRAQLRSPSVSGGVMTVAVTAPVRGRVLRVLRDSAGPVTAGVELIELGDIGVLEVIVDVLSSDAARITPGMSVAIEGWGGERRLTGEVKRVEPSAFTKLSALGVEEQRVKVIVGIPQPPPNLGDGFRVEVRIFTWRGHDVLSVPASALFRERGRWAVYTVHDGRAQLRHVTIGHRGRLDVEVLRGLREGESVVQHPTDRIRDGVRVRTART